MLCDLQIFSGKVYHPEPPHAQSLFLFPIVFGINIVMASVYLYVIGNFFNGQYSPGQKKKEPSPRFTARRMLFHV